MEEEVTALLTHARRLFGCLNEDIGGTSSLSNSQGAARTCIYFLLQSHDPLVAVYYKLKVFCPL